jgi:hypothetical protein
MHLLDGDNRCARRLMASNAATSAPASTRLVWPKRSPPTVFFFLPKYHNTSFSPEERTTIIYLFLVNLFIYFFACLLHGPPGAFPAAAADDGAIADHQEEAR